MNWGINSRINPVCAQLQKIPTAPLMFCSSFMCHFSAYHPRNEYHSKVINVFAQARQLNLFSLCGSPFSFGLVSSEIGRPKTQKLCIFHIFQSFSKKVSTHNHILFTIRFEEVKHFLWYSIRCGNYHQPKLVQLLV